MSIFQLSYHTFGVHTEKRQCMFYLMGHSYKIQTRLKFIMTDSIQNKFPHNALLSDKVCLSTALLQSQVAYRGQEHWTTLWSGLSRLLIVSYFSTGQAVLHYHCLCHVRLKGVFNPRNFWAHLCIEVPKNDQYLSCLRTWTSLLGAYQTTKFILVHFLSNLSIISRG